MNDKNLNNCNVSRGKSDASFSFEHIDMIQKMPEIKGAEALNISNTGDIISGKTFVKGFPSIKWK
jgi:hypothetical protein